MKGDIRGYFDWEGVPALLVARDEDSNYGFYLPEDSDMWENATGANVLDWYKDGEKLSQSRFENKFGVVGEDLPVIPEL